MSGTDVDYIDDLEAGELSVEFEGQEPWDLLEWAIDRFGGRGRLADPGGDDPLRRCQRVVFARRLRRRPQLQEARDQPADRQPGQHPVPPARQQARIHALARPGLGRDRLDHDGTQPGLPGRSTNGRDTPTSYRRSMTGTPRPSAASSAATG